MKTVAVIGTVGLPARYGGFETLVENLTINSSEDYSYTVFCSSNFYDVKLRQYNNANLMYIPLNANGMQSIIYDIASLIKCFFVKPDVTLILGVSGAIFIPFYKLFSRSKVVTNIDGLEWKRNKWNSFVKRFLRFSEKVAVKFSDVVVCDNKAIGDYVNREYAKENVIIAYGGDHVITGRRPYKSKSDYFFSVCRIEPENNVHVILEAFSKTQSALKFVGNWNSSEYGKALKEKYSSYDNIEIIDPIYDVNELFDLRGKAKAYIHGHSAGGTNPSLVEAMHFGIPIFAFDCSFNRHTTDNKSFYFDSSDALISLLNNEEKLDLCFSGEQMLQLAMENYTWAKISQAYETTFQ
jgi:glycosyltransferase involved in cell wall biosynthesis